MGRSPRASRLRPLRRHSRRNEMLSRGNLHMGIKSRNSKLYPYNPGSRNFASFLRLAFTSIERSFVGYVSNALVAPSLIRPMLFCIIRLIRQHKHRSVLFLYVGSVASPCVELFVTGLFNKYLSAKK